MALERHLIEESDLQKIGWQAPETFFQTFATRSHNFHFWRVSARPSHHSDWQGLTSTCMCSYPNFRNCVVARSLQGLWPSISVASNQDQNFSANQRRTIYSTMPFNEQSWSYCYNLMFCFLLVLVLSVCGCMYGCVSMWVCVYVCICFSVGLCMYVYVLVWSMYVYFLMWVFVCLCIYVWLCLSVGVCVYACICAYILVWVFV